MPLMRARIALGIGLVGALAHGCAGFTPPNLESPLGAPTVPPADARVASPSSTPSPGVVAAPVGTSQQIIAFRAPTIILYASPNGADGIRVPAGAVALPLSVRSRASDRLEIATAEGTRWLAAADVMLGPGRP